MEGIFKKIRKNRFRGMLILLLAICVACIDEIQTLVNEEAYISIDGIISRAHNGVHDG